MNNIHAEVDEILRTGNKKAIVSLFLSMQGNYIRATEAEAKLAKAQAEIERKDNLIERMKNCQNCGRTGGFCRHCRYAPDKRGWDDNWKEPI